MIFVNVHGKTLKYGEMQLYLRVSFNLVRRKKSSAVFWHLQYSTDYETRFVTTII